MNTSKLKSFIPIIIIGSLFFIFGFATWINSSLITIFKIVCELSTVLQAFLVTFAFYISYTTMAIPTSKLLEKTGLKRGMMIGLFIMAGGSLLFIPAALTRRYEIFLFGLYIIGTGLTILQTASNPYITIVGPMETAARRISILGICNKLAGVLAPMVLGYIVLNNSDAILDNIELLDEVAKNARLDELAHKLILPYIVMSGILILLGIGIRLSPIPDLEMEEETDATKTDKTSILQFPHLIFGVLALFFYVGAEVIAADTLPQYGIALGMDVLDTQKLTSYTLTAMIAGYLLGIVLIPKIISQRTALIISGILGVVFTIGILLTSGIVSVYSVVLLGFANAIVWPAIWPLAIHNLGKFLKMGSALLIMAIAGGAILPLFWGKFADIYNAQFAYIILIPCYLVILYFALHGYKLRNWKK